MRTIIFPAICLTAFCLLLNSCTDENLENSSLTGRWKWVRTVGGIANHIHETPESVGVNIEIEFSPDKKYKKYTDGILTFERAYSLESKKCIHDHNYKPSIESSDSSGLKMMIEKITPDSLFLSDETYDGIGSAYKRISD